LRVDFSSPEQDKHSTISRFSLEPTCGVRIEQTSRPMNRRELLESTAVAVAATCADPSLAQLPEPSRGFPPFLLESDPYIENTPIDDAISRKRRTSDRFSEVDLPGYAGWPFALSQRVFTDPTNSRIFCPFVMNYRLNPSLSSVNT
jgi:hypothetical protein